MNSKFPAPRDWALKWDRSALTGSAGGGELLSLWAAEGEKEGAA